VHSIGDFSGIIAIEFSINVALGYIQVLLRPQIERSASQFANATWWISHEAEYENLIGKRATFEEYNEAYSEWEHSRQKLKRSIDKHIRIPTTIMICNAAFLFFVLCFPWYETNLQTLYSIIIVGAYLPVFCIIWLYKKTEEPRVDERRKKDEVADLIP